jgi:hypothetical protein
MNGLGRHLSGAEFEAAAKQCRPINQVRRGLSTDKERIYAEIDCPPKRRREAWNQLRG